jgi:regulator of cell morphogenesis and NO signaling
MQRLAQDTEDHMAEEEGFPFPAMRRGSVEGLKHPNAVMRADHEDHAENIALIRRLTNDLTLPGHACGSWRALYGGTSTLLGELAAHIAVEDDVLFPRFEPDS